MIYFIHEEKDMKSGKLISPVLLAGFAIAVSASAITALANMRSNPQRVIGKPITSTSPAKLHDRYAGWHSKTDKQSGVTIRYPADWETASDWLEKPGNDRSQLIVGANTGTNLNQAATVTVDSALDEQNVYGSNKVKLSDKSFPGLLTAQADCQSEGGPGHGVTCHDPVEDDHFVTGLGTEPLLGHKIRFTTSVVQQNTATSNAPSTSLVSPPTWIIPFTPPGTTKSMFIVISTWEEFVSDGAVEKTVDLIAKSVRAS